MAIKSVVDTKTQSGVKYLVSFIANSVFFIFLKNPTYLKSPIALIANTAIKMNKRFEIYFPKISK